jgi:hypothetical protein
VKDTFNAFWQLPGVQIERLHMPDLLHRMYLGMLKHLMEWIESFLRKHDRLRQFDQAWISIMPYPGFTPPTRPYREISQWQGKEMRNLGRVILCAFAASLGPPPASQRSTGNWPKALCCVRSLVDFHLMAQYQSHTPETLNFMDKYLTEFHQTKEVFLEFRASKGPPKSHH